MQTQQETKLLTSFVEGVALNRLEFGLVVLYQPNFPQFDLLEISKKSISMILKFWTYDLID